MTLVILQFLNGNTGQRARVTVSIHFPVCSKDSVDKPGMVAHAGNPSAQEAEEGESL